MHLCTFSVLSCASRRRAKRRDASFGVALTTAASVGARPHGASHPHAPRRQSLGASEASLAGPSTATKHLRSSYTCGQHAVIARGSASETATHPGESVGCRPGSPASLFEDADANSNRVQVDGQTLRGRLVTLAAGRIGRKRVSSPASARRFGGSRISRISSINGLDIPVKILSSSNERSPFRP